MSWKVRLLALLTLVPLSSATLALVPLHPRPWIDEAAASKEIVNSIGMKLIRIDPGTFRMGSPNGEEGRNANETVHEVEITKPFHLGKYEVTQAEYLKVVGANPSQFKDNGNGKIAGNSPGRGLPVENVSWDDAKAFCRKLTERERNERNIPVQMEYTLPTEAEWEYCCRAGTSTAFHYGASINFEQANFNGGQGIGNRGRTTEVGSFAPNAWGLCDMHGNLAEWCEDWYDSNYYNNSPRRDPPGPNKANIRVLRGGSWMYVPGNCRSGLRDGIGANFRSNFCGFRVALRQARRPL